MSTFILKIIAAITMTIDHAGLLLCGNETWMRAVGRIAFPLYAFFIAEGFRYTKNRLRYFLDIFVLGQLCQLAYEIVMPIPNRTLNILITFSFSILLLYLMERAKESRRDLAVFGAALIGVFVFCRFIHVDYGFFGVILPLFPALFEKKWARLGAFAAGLLLLCTQSSSIQFYSLFALVCLALYNGKRGKYKLKYFFYLFYPAHLAILWAIRYFT